VTLYRATVFDTPDDPFRGGVLRAEQDAGVVVDESGMITARGPFRLVRADHPDEEVIALTEGVLLPGMVDTHVHFPQVRVIGGLGLPLLDWLDRRALPEECRLADVEYARGVARDFVTGLVAAGTTTALVFGSHFAPAVDIMFETAHAAGLRVTTGLVVSDRNLPPELLTTADRAHDEAATLAKRWHGTGSMRYAVTPRFSFSASDAMLESCAATFAEVPGSWFTSHVNENPAEIAEVARLFDGSRYVNTYADHGLIERNSVLAHNVHPHDEELALLADRGASVAHCPTSNAALGSGLFPLRRHVEHGVRVALGSDVGAGTGFSLLKEGLQAYFAQQLLGDQGLRLGSAHLLWLATAAGADALGLAEVVGYFGIGKQFDAIWVLPDKGNPLDVGLANAHSAEDALAKVFALGTSSDVAGVWVGGDQIGAGRWYRPPVS
jgi:guanine deaminase